MKKQVDYSINAFNLGFSQNSTLSGIVSDETGTIPGSKCVTQKLNQRLHD
jgi:hypothetical protein